LRVSANPEDTIYRFLGEGTWINLSSHALAWTWWWGQEMRDDAVRRGMRDLKPSNYGEIKKVSIHADGCMGELAVSRMLGLGPYWPRMGTTHSEPDLGKGDRGVDVRAARLRNYGMWVRPEDTGPWPQALVLLHEIKQWRPLPEGKIYTPGRALVVGWYWPREARRHPEWYQHFGTGREPGYVVPQEYLYPMQDLITMLGYPGRTHARPERPAETG